MSINLNQSLDSNQFCTHMTMKHYRKLHKHQSPILNPSLQNILEIGSSILRIRLTKALKYHFKAAHAYVATKHFI